MTRGLLALLMLAAVTPGSASSPLIAGRQSPESGIVAALRMGGCVLVMRHASSPREAPDKAAAQPDNTKLERQLDAAGRAAATAMGDALVRLRIPIEGVFSSPTYRALETLRLMRVAKPQTVEELGDGGQSMQGASDAQATWLRTHAAEPPRSGNTFIVTHLPNLTRAFPEWGSTVADGEVVVLQPDGRGGTRTVGRMPIERWPDLR